MKRIGRMLIFSAFALFFTSMWNKGFVISGDIATFMTASLFLAVIFYVIIPLSKILLLPLNILTLGFMSFVVYLAILHFGSSTFHLFEISAWQFHSYAIPYLANLVLSSLSISSIINVLERLL